VSKFKDLFFDLDNTILDFSHASHIAFREMLDHFGHNESSEIYTIYNEGNHEVWKDFEDGKITALQLRAERFNRLLSKMEWSGSGLEWNKIYIECIVRNTKYVDGALEVISNLSERYDIHIVTNGLKEAQRPRIRTAELGKFLASITVSDEIGIAKPHHDFFKVAMRNAKVDDKSKVLMIGDSYRSDIAGGVNFGLQTCWFNHNKNVMDQKMHDFEIHHISELEDILL
jgi:putative hydrolase of the HAD superfamily